jgi:hypothetical protein
MLLNKSFLFGSVVLFTVLLSLAFTGCISPTDSTSGFEETVHDALANDKKTLGLVGDEAKSSAPSIATASIANGKIRITSKAVGKVEITVSDSTNSAAIIAVVDNNGKIAIDDITKYVDAHQTAVKITELPPNQTIVLALTNSKDITSDPSAAATGIGKTYANGTAQVSLLDDSGDAWNGSGSFYVSIILDGKIMTSKDQIAFTAAKNIVPCTASDCEEVSIKEQTGSLTITGIPATYSHIMVSGMSANTIFMGASLIGSVLVVNRTATITLLAADSESGKLVDFPAEGDYILGIVADTEPFISADGEPPATAKTFMGAAKFTNKAATVDWLFIMEAPSGE